MLEEIEILETGSIGFGRGHLRAGRLRVQRSEDPCSMFPPQWAGDISFTRLVSIRFAIQHSTLGRLVSFFPATNNSQIANDTANFRDCTGLPI